MPDQAVRTMSSSGCSGFPAEFVDGFVGAGDEDAGIACTARMDLNRDWMTGDAASGINDFAHAEALSIAQVVDQWMKIVDRCRCRSGGRFERIERQKMGVGEVGDVDIVADASAVRGGVIVAEDLDEVTAAEGDIKNQRDEVGLGLVGFSLVIAPLWLSGAPATLSTAARHSAGRESGSSRRGPSRPGALTRRRIRRDKSCILLNRNTFRLAVNGGGGGKYEASGAMGQHGLKQRKRGCRIVPEEDLGPNHGFAGFNQRGEVQHTIEGIA